jgi:hypothetical protein
MKIISHRGNLNGPDKDNENKPSQILLAIAKGFDVEVDLWVVGKRLFLGHDLPQYSINISFLENIKNSLWVHCKNLNAIKFLQESPLDLNYFWHQSDDFTLTSWGHVWTYPGKKLTQKSVCVLPEINNVFLDNVPFGICTDYPYRNWLK